MKKEDNRGRKSNREQKKQLAKTIVNTINSNYAGKRKLMCSLTRLPEKELKAFETFVLESSEEKPNSIETNVLDEVKKHLDSNEIELEYCN